MLVVVLLTCLEVGFLARLVTGFIAMMVAGSLPVVCGPDWFCTRATSEICKPLSALVCLVNMSSFLVCLLAMGGSLMFLVSSNSFQVGFDYKGLPDRVSEDYLNRAQPCEKCLVCLLFPSSSCSVIVINNPPISPWALLPAVLSLVAKGISYLLVIPRAWVRFITATAIWAPK